jgi:hypothetical protein
VVIGKERSYDEKSSHRDNVSFDLHSDLLRMWMMYETGINIEERCNNSV